ncbi:MAG: response regulator [Candidatus Rokubacteria bacterium]|nr:response regulator [Candidatus Rokubacteria bacterium]
MSRHPVWYVPGSEIVALLEHLPEDLELRPATDLSPVACSGSHGVLVVHLPGGDSGIAAMTVAQRAGLPVVALVNDGVSDGVPGHPCYAYLSPSVQPSTLAAVLRAACEEACVRAETRETSTQLEELSTIGISLSAERNLDALLELILTKGREITRSDAGSLYVVEKTPDGGQHLRFKLAQNDSVRVALSEWILPISSTSAAGYVALSGEILRIDDAYALPPKSPYRINNEVDAGIGYRTTSMLVVPMKTPAGEIIGVLQLINCKRVPGRPLARPEALHDEVMPFPERYRNLAASLASQAGVAIQNAQLLEELRVALQEIETQQQQLVQTERLSALGEMAAGVAHDFNNLLAVVVGRAEVLLAKVQEPEICRNVKVIRQAAWDGAQTIRRIQEFTRTRQTRPAGRVEVPELLRDVIELTRGRWKDEAQSRNIVYEVLIEGRPVPPVAGISAELREVFMNLLINGLDAMPGGGRFIFRVSSDMDTVTIAAQDTGCGMSDEIRWRVLEPFFTTKGSRGTGLGLSVSWGIVKRHGGTIDIESSLGVGSTFVVRLPVSKEEPAAEEPAAEAPASVLRPVRTARVLVIDDELEIRCVLRDMLTSFGHTVLEAASGEEGLACCDGAGVDVILTDVSMPGMSGWDVAAVCRRRFPRIPLGFVTGWGDRLDPEETLRSGVRFVLSKPFAPVDLQNLVAGVLTPDSFVESALTSSHRG